MLEAAKKRPQILTDPEPVVHLKEFADSGISLELIIWVEDPEGGILHLRSSLNLEIWSSFRKMVSRYHSRSVKYGCCVRVNRKTVKEISKRPNRFKKI